jgi:hypothetical protein
MDISSDRVKPESEQDETDKIEENYNENDEG